MIFVPLPRARADALRSAGRTDTALIGYAATPTLMRAHGFDARADEDANFTAQTYAMIVSLRFPDAAETGRIVLALDAPVPTLDDLDNADGETVVTGAEWRWVQAVFSDGSSPDPATLAAVRAAAEVVAGATDLGAAAELPAVGELIDDHDLLWHVPEEQW